MKRILLLLISVSLVITILIGCSQSTPTQGDIENLVDKEIAGKYNGTAVM